MAQELSIFQDAVSGIEDNRTMGDRPRFTQEKNRGLSPVFDTFS